MQPEDKRCSKLETHTFFLSFFQDGVVLVSGPRNSLCAWTSILACFYSLPKHLCFILVTYKMPYILILTGGRGGAEAPRHHKVLGKKCIQHSRENAKGEELMVL